MWVRVRSRVSRVCRVGGAGLVGRGRLDACGHAHERERPAGGHLARGEARHTEVQVGRLGRVRVWARARARVRVRVWVWVRV